MSRPLRSVLQVTLATLLVLPLVGALYEIVATRIGNRRGPSAGRLVDAGGRKSLIECEGSGSPAVVFASGLGEGSDSWWKVRPEVAKVARACSYDRAGLGWSDAAPPPRDVDHMASELHNLLRAAGVDPPYLLVGHSLGGGVIRVFAGTYPSEVTGLVMVDAAHPDLLHRTRPDAWDLQAKSTAERMRILALFGIARLDGACKVDGHPLVHCGDFWSTVVEERKELPESLREVGAVSSIGDKELVVLSRDPDPKVGWGSPELRSSWEEMQEELPRLSTRGRQIVVKGATHYIQLDKPEAVIDAVTSVLASSRRSNYAREHR